MSKANDSSVAAAQDFRWLSLPKLRDETTPAQFFRVSYSRNNKANVILLILFAARKDSGGEGFNEKRMPGNRACLI